MDKTCCIFGDSVVQAEYVKNSWPTLLREFLEEKYKNDWFDFFNLGIGGNTTYDILKRLKNECEARMSTQIVFGIGVNDSGYYKNSGDQIVPKEKFAGNLGKIIEISKKFTSDITFVGLVLGDDSLLQPFPESSQGKSYSRDRVVEYDKALENVATENGCKYIYLFDKLNNGDFMDGLHPNEKGHNKMFEEIKKFF